MLQYFPWKLWPRWFPFVWSEKKKKLNWEVWAGSSWKQLIVWIWCIFTRWREFNLVNFAIYFWGEFVNVKIEKLNGFVGKWCKGGIAMNMSFGHLIKPRWSRLQWMRKLFSFLPEIHQNKFFLLRRKLNEKNEEEGKPEILLNVGVLNGLRLFCFKLK